MNDEDFKRLPRSRPKPSLKYAELSRLHRERQSAIISTLLQECPETLPAHCEKLLSHAPESFDDIRYGVVAAAVWNRLRNHHPVSILTVQEHLAKLPDAPDLSEIFRFLSLQPMPLSPVLLELECEELWNAYNFRRQATLFNEAAQSLIAHPDQAPHISENVRRSIEELTRNGHSMPEIVCGHQLLITPLAPPDVLIEGLLHKGSKLSLGGGSKTFKSWTFLSIAHSLACGRDWLGMPCTRCRVLLVNFEIQEYWMQYRLAQICNASNGLKPERGYLDFWNLRGYSAPHATIIPKIIERAKSRGYGLVIIDPSYKLIGQGDENSASDVGAMMGSFEKIAVETSSAVGFAAHFAKGNAAAKESIDRISGSGVFARDPDTILTFTAHEQDNCYTVEATLRNFPHMQPFVVEWDFPSFKRKDGLNPEDLKKRAGRPARLKSQELLDLLKDKPLSTSDWQRQAKTELGVSPSTFHRLKPELENSGLVFKSKLSQCWTLSNSKEKQ